MKSSITLIVIMVIWATTIAPSCNPSQAKQAAKVGQNVVQKVKNFFKKPRPTKPVIHPMPLITTARVLFKVVDAAGKEVAVNNPALQAELSIVQIIEQPRLVEIAQKIQTKFLFARIQNNGELSYEQQLAAFNEVLKEIKASKGLYTFVLGYVCYKKQSNSNSDYYIIASKMV